MRPPDPRTVKGGLGVGNGRRLDEEPMTRSARRQVVPPIVLGVLLVAGVAGAQPCRDRTPTTWDIEVAPSGEPGERLIVTGRVVSAGEGKPLSGITVYVYHADAKGNYNLPGHEKEPPRLCGILITNARGEYRIRTRMPGGYSGFAAHIHYEIWGPHVSRQHAFVNLVPEKATMDTSKTLPQPRFHGPRESGMWRQSNLTSTERPVFRGADGTFRCARDLEVATGR
jgi:intradiol ring-cleaving dioxygenase-like protein